MQKNVQTLIKERRVGRQSPERVAASHRTISKNPILTALLDAMTDYVLVLNEQRQIVAVNRVVLTALGVDHPDELLGRRPGEVFGCMHANEGEEGCGTGLHCTECGATFSVVAAQETGKQVVQECRLMLDKAQGSALDLEVATTPLSLDGQSFFVCTLKDISAAKRRSVLERIFFHDVMNTAGGIHGLADLLAEGESLPREKEREYKSWMRDLSARLIEEITQQKQLLAAERGELVLDTKAFSSSRVLEEVQALYENHDSARKKGLQVDAPDDVILVSDEIIVRRILGNLVKNALEASSAGDTVTLTARKKGGDLEFAIHNPGFIPESIRLRIFKRSFSTKATTGRGIGTYSVRLLGERYLKGTVGFTSDEINGTTFTFSLPLDVPAASG